MNPTTKPKDEPLHVYKDAQVTSTVYSHYGVDTTFYNALNWIDDSIVIIPSGKFIIFLDFQSGDVQYQDGPDDGGVGTVAVHPSRKYFAVGERRPSNPGVCIYSWPERELIHCFKGGATIGFCASCFDAEGSRMATVGSFPDFTLVIWDWTNRNMILRCKCFGSDISTVRFSGYDNSLLVTSGAGHIKFWTMAKTFTGLKLQGTLGKFGRLEISSVSGFAVLPDGKVLSGSENGCLLLWEGDLVKCSFVRKILKKDEDDHGAFQQTAFTYIPAHASAVNCVCLAHNGKVVVTAGDDGYIRYWSREEMDVAEGDGLPPLYAPKLLLEICVGNTLHIRSLTRCSSRNVWCVLDSQGVICTSPFPTLQEIFDGVLPEPQQKEWPAIQFNGGGIACSTISSKEHTIVTGGTDGVVRLIDYVRGKEKFHRRWAPLATPPNPVTFIEFFRTHPSQNVFIVGFWNGTVQLMQRQAKEFSLLGTWKPHSDGLFTVAISEDESKLATVSKNGTVFFFEVGEERESLQPIGFCKPPLASPLCAVWDEYGENSGCCLGFEGGEIISICAPKEGDVHQEVSFEFTCSYSLIGVRQRRLPPPRDENDPQLEEEENLLEEKDNGPWAVLFMKRLDNRKVAIGFRKEELVYTYELSIRYPGVLALPALPPTGVEPPNYVEEPGENLCYRNMLPVSVFLCQKRSELLVVCEKSNIILRAINDSARNTPSVTLVGQSHDSTRTPSVITGAFSSFDGRMIVTTGMDGMVISLLRDNCEPPPATSPTEPQLQPLAVLFAEEEEAPWPVLSIQEQKEEDDKAREEAENQRRKNFFLGKVRALHEKLIVLLKRNEKLPSSLKLLPDALEIDPTLKVRLQDDKMKRIEEARKPYILETARENIRTKKIRNRYVDCLIFDRFLVNSFDKEFYVSSFRTLHPGEAINRLRTAIKGLEDSVSESDLDDDENEKEGGHRQITESEATQEAQELISLQKEEDRIGSSHMSASIKQQLNKLDERRRERQERFAGYQALLRRKPNPEEDSQELNRLREHDIQVRGECVLRTDPHYKGKPGFAPTATCKLVRTIYLAEYLVDRRTSFNHKLLKMRDSKEEKIKLLNTIRSRIAELNEALNDHSVDASPLCLEADEEPEKRYTTDRDGLAAFSREREQERIREEQAKKAQRGFGADLAGAGSKKPSAEARDSGMHSFSQAHGGRQSIFNANANRDRLDAELKTKLENIKPSEIEEEEKEICRAEFLSERLRLIEESRSISAQFDRDLKELVFERAAVDADICLADSRLLLLFREYQLLLVFRKRDKELLHELKDTKRSREKYRSEIVHHKSEISKITQAMDGINERLRQANQEAEAYLQENCPADKLGYIMKVYYRQLKRKKNVVDDEDNDDITSDDDEDFEIDDGIGEEICPSNCDYGVWENMLRLREIRLDITDELSDSKENQDLLQRKKEECEGKVDALVEKLKECQKEKELLEAEKRKELNMLNAVVSLQCHQVKVLDESGMCPGDLHLNPVLVIADQELVRLDSRISELAVEKRQRREEIASMGKEHQELQEEKKRTQMIHDDWDSKVHEVMMLKFGQRVDLELLESCGTSRRIEAKKEQLRNAELKWERDIRKYEAKIANLRDRLQEAIIDNTHLLQDYSTYERERQSLDGELSAATKKTIQRYRGARVATLKDRLNLRTLILAQQQEMDALSAEIIMLRRKGGHAYTVEY